MALDDLLHRKRPSLWQRFMRTPYPVLAETLYTQRQHIVVHTLPCTRPLLGITVICISDTHNSMPDLPPGDILIHAGDMTQGGSAKELQAQLDWLNKQTHQHKIVVAGNHDIVLDKEKAAELDVDRPRPQSLRWGSIIYLKRSATSLNLPSGQKISIYGHPDTRKNGNWGFQYNRDIDAFTDQVPDGVDILVTHSPPQFHLDGAGLGDKNLLRELWRVKPRLHVFGHVHESYGQERLVYDRFECLYERVRAGNEGFTALLRMVVLLLPMLVLVCFARTTMKQTTLVNAAVVGGLNDAERRRPQVVLL